MNFEVNQYFELVVSKGIYAGKYLTCLLAMNEEVFAFSTPMKRGKIIAITPGTVISLHSLDTQETYVFEAEVLSRKTEPVAALIISRPNRISKAQRLKGSGKSQVIAITSGKGGVGKTSFTVNIAITLSRMGKRVLIMDADIGLANVEVLMGCYPKYNLSHVMTGKKDMDEIIVTGPDGVKLISGGSGFKEISDLSDHQLRRFIYALNKLEEEADIILIDTGAGISNKVLNFVLAADEVIVITTTEPTAITDAYAMIKAIVNESSHKKEYLKVIVNKAQDEKEAQQTLEKLDLAMRKFLDISLQRHGIIQHDEKMMKAVMEQQPVVLSYPHSKAAQTLKRIALQMVNGEEILLEEETNTHIKSFFSKLTHLFR